MRYTIIRDDVEKGFEVDWSESGRLRLVDGDRQLEFDVRHLPGGGVHILSDNRSCDVSVLLDGSDAICALRGRSVELSVYTERELRLMRLERASKGTFDPVVLSPMAGKVIAVEIRPGQAVAEGDAMVVVEAMKMENIIRAPHAGRIDLVDVEHGQTVEAGARLVVLAPLAEEDVA